jgi:hypothetical protein
MAGGLCHCQKMFTINLKMSKTRSPTQEIDPLPYTGLSLKVQISRNILADALTFT